MNGNTNIWLNGIMGVVVGDALGCPVQFESREEVARHPVTGMRGYGTFNLPEGSWTDDSSLTIALLESIRRVGKIDLDDIMENFMKWLYDGEFTPYGESYDIGRGTMQAINRYKKNRKAKKCGGDEEWNNGNGSLMRIMPACLYTPSGRGRTIRGFMTPYLLMLSMSCSICPSAFTLNGWFRNSRRRSISISTIFSSGSISFTLTGISTPSFLHSFL